jgi:hypothetical protein
VAERDYERDYEREQQHRGRRDFDYERGRPGDAGRRDFGREGEFQGGYERERFGQRGDFGRQGWTSQQGGYGREGQYGGYGQQGWSGQHGEFGREGQYQGDYGRSGYGRESYGGGYGGFAPRSTWSYTEMWIIPGPFTGRGPKGFQRSDERIKEEVCERLTQHGQLDASEIEVQVNGGVVTLTGAVDHRQAKRMAEDTVEGVSGVKDVHNQIRVNHGQMGQMGSAGQMGSIGGGSNWTTASTSFRQDWERTRGQSGGTWQDVEPGYRYGFEMAGDQRFRGRKWNEVEPEFRSGYADWARRQGYQADESAWDRLKDQIRHGWERVTGQATH